MEIFCRNIRYLRKHHQLTQKQMAGILKIGVSSVRKIEKGILPRCMNSKALRRLCDYFVISADFVLCQDMKVML